VKEGGEKVGRKGVKGTGKKVEGRIGEDKKGKSVSICERDAIFA